MHQLVPYLSLLQDTEKLSLELLGRNGPLSNDYLRGFRGISHSAHIKSLLVYYQQASMRLVSAFSRRRLIMCLVKHES